MKSVDAVVALCVQNGYISSELTDWLKYALEKRLTTLIISVPLLIVGGFISPIETVISFYISFRMLRKWTNGIHARTFWTCFTASIISEILFLCCVLRYLTPITSCILLLASTILIAFMSPYNNPNIHLSKSEIIACSIKARKILLHALFTLGITYFSGFKRISDGILLGIVMAGATLALAYINNGGIKNAKENARDHNQKSCHQSY